MSEYIPPPPPSAGWYPDPSGQPGRRYHDGATWTEHFVPDPPSALAPQQSVVVNNHIAAPSPGVAIAVAGRGTSHGLHLVLTLVTCGLWLPIWIIAALFGGGGKAVAVSGGGTQSMKAPKLQRDGKVVVPDVNSSVDRMTAFVSDLSPKAWRNIGIGFAVFMLVGLMGNVPWTAGVILPLTVIGGVAFYNLRKKTVRDEEAQQLAMRAEYENDLQAQGDPRGTHGRFPPAAE